MATSASHSLSYSHSLPSTYSFPGICSLLCGYSFPVPACFLFLVRCVLPASVPIIQGMHAQSRSCEHLSFSARSLFLLLNLCSLSGKLSMLDKVNFPCTVQSSFFPLLVPALLIPPPFRGTDSIPVYSSHYPLFSILFLSSLSSLYFLLILSSSLPA